METRALPATSSTFVMQWPVCNDLSDVSRAAWCDCVGRESTLVCPVCRKCFCRAPLVEKTKFWRSAPASLWIEKMRRLRSDDVRPQAKSEALPIEKPSNSVVLIADDSRVIRIATERALHGLDCTIIQAADGAEALRLAQVYRPEVVISDALMPKLDGRAMCEAIKADPALAHAKVVIMSALYTAARYRTEARQFGVDTYLAKPVDPVALNDLVRQMLAEASLHRSAEHAA